jgi:sugar/nucleoside kinase (ribokinase family)
MKSVLKYRHMQYDFVGIGDIVTDAFIKLSDPEIHTQVDHGNNELCMRFGDKIPYDDVIEVRAVGNSPNATVSAARLGLTTALVTNMGRDRIGEDSLEYLKSQNVRDEFITLHEGKVSNYHYVLQFGPERTILIKHQSYDRTFPTMESPKWMYFSSIGPDSLPHHAAIGEYLKTHPDVKLAFQPGTYQIRFGTDALKDIYQRTEIFFCNKEEAIMILQSAQVLKEVPHSDVLAADMKVLLSGVRALGPKIAVITDGPNGAFADDGNAVYMVPMYPDPQPPISRTGAGDACSSTITAYLAMGYSLEDALIRGPINSAYVVQQFGAQKGLLTKEQLEGYLATAPADYKVTTV